MAHNSDLKSINLRMDASIWQACKEIAEQRHQSFNQFVQGVLAKAAMEARKEMVRKAFADLATENPDVEYAFAAQSEVALGEFDATTP